MAARARRPAGIAGPALMMVTGLLVLGLGLVQLQRLERTHLPQELLYPVSDQTLLLWLRTQNPGAPETVALIRDRLLDLTLEQRREAVAALAGNRFWAALDPEPQMQRSWQEVALAATEQAVAKAPTAGDLWLLAGVLRTRLAGLDRVAQGYVELSATYAPREMDLVITRLTLLGVAWPLLGEALQDVVQQDLAVAEVAYPDRARQFRAFLEQAGANLK